MRILKLLLALGSVAGATSITSAVGGNPNPLLTTGDIWAGTTNGAPTNLPAGASGTFLGSNGTGIAPTYQLINYSSLTGTVPTWNQSTTGSAATLTTPRTIATSGDAVGTATSFNGSANISIPTTVVAVNGAAVPASKTIVGTNASSQIIDASAATLANNTTGSAATLTTPRTIATSGDAVGTATNFNGSANISIPTTVVAVNGAAIPASKTIVGTNASSQIIDASAATLSNSTTGNAATATKWQTARNLIIGSSTQALDGTAALTYSLAAIGAAPSVAGGYLPLSAGSGYPITGSLYTVDNALQYALMMGRYSSGVGYSIISAMGAGSNSNGIVLQTDNAGTPTSGIWIKPDGSPTLYGSAAGTGTAVLTSGTVSSLSGTNLVLGNGSTIPQSTFQPALSGGTTGALTKWASSSTLTNAVANTDYLPVSNPSYINTLTGTGSITAGGPAYNSTITVTGAIPSANTIGFGSAFQIFGSSTTAWAMQLGVSGGLNFFNFASPTWTLPIQFSAAGNITATGSITAGGSAYNSTITAQGAVPGADLIGYGAALQVFGASSTAWAIQLGQSGNLDFFNYGSSTWTLPIKFSAAGNITATSVTTSGAFSSNVTGGATAFYAPTGSAYINSITLLGSGPGLLQQTGAGSAVTATTTPSVTSLTATGTGTAINAPNGNISAQGAASTGGEVIGGTAAIGTANYNSTYGWVGLSGKNGASNATDFGILFDATGSPNLNSSASSSGYILAAGIQEANWNTTSFNFTEPVTFNGIVARQSYNRNTSAISGNVTVSTLYSVISLEPGSSNPTTLTTIPNGTVDGQQLTLIQNAPTTCVVSSSNLVATFSLTTGSSRNLTWNNANSKWL